MNTIYRYPLPISSDASQSITVDMPVNARPIHFDLSRNELCVWAQVDTEVPVVPTAFYLAMTGVDLPENLSRHIGSVVTHGGAFAAHLFEAIQTIN